MDKNIVTEQKPKMKLYQKPGFYAILAGLIALVWFIAGQIELKLFSWGIIGIAAGIGGILIALAGFFLFYAKDQKSRLAGWLMIVLVCLFSYFSAEIFDPVYTSLQSMAYHPSTLKEYAGIYTYKQAPLSSIEALDGSAVGILQDKNSTLTDKVIEELSSQNITIKTMSYSNIQQLFRALKGQAVRAIIINESDLALAKEFGGLSDISSDLIQLYSYCYDTQVQNTAGDADLMSQPFTILLSASADSLEDDSYRSYATMLIAVNPETRDVLRISIPRNLKVSYVCDGALACTGGMEDKISLSSLHTIEAARATLESLLGEKIDYTIRVDLNSLVGLADMSGELQVDNEYEYSSGNYYFPTGSISMNTAMARQYISDLNDFSQEDSWLENNQLNVLRAILNQTKFNSLLEIKPVMDLLAQSCQTNFSYEELIEIFQMFFLYDFHWKYYDVSLEGEEVWEYSSQLTSEAYMKTANEDSLQFAGNCLQALLNGKITEAFQQADADLQSEQTQSQQQQEQSEQQAAEDAAFAEDYSSDSLQIDFGGDVYDLQTDTSDLNNEQEEE